MALLRLNIKNKLFIGFGVMLIIMLCLAFVFFKTLKIVSSIHDEAIRKVYLDMYLDEKVGEHYKWMSELADLLLVGEEFKGELSADICDFGKWYAGFNSDDPEIVKIYPEIEEPHNMLHSAAKKVVENYRSTDLRLALKMADAEIAHLSWMLRLRDLWQPNAIPFTGETEPSECVFGKWYYLYRDEAVSPEVKDVLYAIEVPHQKLHHSAKEILALAGVDGVISEPEAVVQARKIYNEKTELYAAQVMSLYNDIKNIVFDDVRNTLEAESIYSNEARSAAKDLQAKVAKVQQILMQDVDELMKKRVKIDKT
ncbi:MAG: CZB domain-containing protein, partial [Candidatus Omnitrophota bacterium]